MKYCILPALAALLLAGCSEGDRPQSADQPGHSGTSLQTAPASVPGNPDSEADPADMAFVEKAASSNLLEIRSSELALERSDTEAVQAFARRMIDGHRTAAHKLSAALQQTPLRRQAPDRLSDHHQSILSRLESADEVEFDAAFVRVQQDAHREAISLFSDYAAEGKSEPLRGFASDLLPELNGHLEEASSLQLPEAE